MLTIRSSQLSILSLAQLERFVDHALTVVTRHWGDEVARIGGPAARARVRVAFEQAQALGLLAEAQALRFINVSFALGADFMQRHDWARRLMNRLDTPAEARLALLVDKTTAYLDGEII